MSVARLAIDPVWQCLCPAWNQVSLLPTSYVLGTARQPGRYRTRTPTHAQWLSKRAISTSHTRHDDTPTAVADPSTTSTTRPARVPPPPPLKPASTTEGYATAKFRFRNVSIADTVPETLLNDSTPHLYARLKAHGINGRTKECRVLAEYLVRERREQPNLRLYEALITSQVDSAHGAAWRVSEYLEEMREEGLQPDVGICHAVFKVLSVHPDHLLRADMLEYMRTRWISLSEDGARDLTASMLREGLFEQAMRRIDDTLHAGGQDHAWLLDMAVYMLCDVGELGEACRLMQHRHEQGELLLSKNVWYALLDAGSMHRHHPSASLAWITQVSPGYINPSTGICLNVLTTAAQAGDAALATDVFTHLSKRGTVFTPLHYQLLIDCYLSAPQPDLKRALSILCIMAQEKTAQPTLAETRSLYLYLRDNPPLVGEAFAILRDLHQSGRTVPITALNLLIECYTHQKSLKEALNVYKLMHTFIRAEGTGQRKILADVETFNLLLRCCRLADPPDEGMASFLVSELLALRIKPNAMTYDRLILVFTKAGQHALEQAEQSHIEPGLRDAERQRGLKLLDWAFRHFVDMRAVSASSTPEEAEEDTMTGSLGWMPRFATVETLAVQLAKVQDPRCWDVLQAGEDQSADVEGWEAKGKHVRRNVEEAWAMAEERRASVDMQFNGESASTENGVMEVSGAGDVLANDTVEPIAAHG